MQANTNNTNMNAAANQRATKWIPAEVWQRQGMTAQVLTLPGGLYLFLIQSKIGYWTYHVNCLP